MARDAFKIDVDYTQLRRELRKAGNEDLKKELLAANKELAIDIVRAATPYVPVRTGRLFQSLRGQGLSSGAVGKAGNARVPYAQVVHWGSARKGIRAQPFLWTAAKKVEGRVVAVYEEHIRRLFEKVSSR